ncbi:glycoside hydrolase family 9 protein [Ruminococcus flavefaciens]|uniref:glycoside hydrolase family 9 protein n=1 Tax=Ruminococcus flavefaciens TaxID=1265 RepID=UPI000463BB7E|nr:glycoside hydrolase family 9 protein [Ruminococcus flavefaciens]
MNKLNRLKSAIISGAVAVSALAAPLSAVSPSLTATAADGDNYAKLLQYSLYFYDANMCGNNSDCALTWRGNCHMNDVVPGGFHDAGDHVMFGQPQGYAASTLGWSYYEFKDAYEATGQGAHLKVITDKFCKFFRDATKLNGNTVSEVLIEKGEGNTDHAYWGAPETQGDRGRMLWSSGGAANVTAEYAAALAANYVNFGNADDLKYAKALYEFSKKDKGFYSAGTFYDAHWTGSEDEIAWAAGWLYLATKEDTYLNDLKNCPIAYSVHSWESVQLGAAILKGEITGDWGNASELGKFNGDGYYFANEWGSARHNATAQLCSLVAAKYNKANSSWAKGQMQYLTGDKAFANGQSHCLVVGFKSNSSKNPHHRAASPDVDASKGNDGQNNKYLLVGALCGGPLDANGTYQDVRSDYQGNEVAVDYNAGFVGAAAGLYHFYKTGSTVSTIEGVKKIYSGSSSSTPDPVTTPTTTTTKPDNGNNNNNTTTTTKPNTSSGSGKTLLPADMKVGVEEGDDGEMNNYAEFSPDGAKKATLYLKVNTNDTEVSGGFGTWTGTWDQVEFSGVKVNSDKTVAIDYDIPSKVGSTIKAMVWWPHGNGVTIEKIVLDGDGSNNSASAKTTTKPNNGNNTTTTTKPDNSSSSSSGNDKVLTASDMKVDTEEGDDGKINNYAEFAPDGAKSCTLYLKVNSSDTEVSGAFGTWTGEWEQEDFKGVKVGSDKTVAIDYTFPSKVGSTIKAMVFWPHGDDVTIEKVVLHTSGSSSNVTTTRVTTTTTRTTTKETTTTTRTTTTTAPNKELDAKLLGDANCDNQVDLSDVVLIMQSLANPNKYGLNGSDRTHLTEQGQANADVHRRGNGVTSNDALAIQMKLLNLISSLPVDQV